jgi:hypothetical protein
MVRVIASLCGLLVYGSLGVASIGGEPPGAEEPVRVKTPIKIEILEVATSGSAAPVPMGEMSQQEKERRREVCRKVHDQCYDQCTRFYSKKNLRKKLQPCYERCIDNMADCMKEIPN